MPRPDALGDEMVASPDTEKFMAVPGGVRRLAARVVGRARADAVKIVWFDDLVVRRRPRRARRRGGLACDPERCRPPACAPRPHHGSATRGSSGSRCCSTTRWSGGSRGAGLQAVACARLLPDQRAAGRTVEVSDATSAWPGGFAEPNARLAAPLDAAGIDRPAWLRSRAGGGSRRPCSTRWSPAGGPARSPSGARSSTDRASDYGSEGWGFESLRAR